MTRDTGEHRGEGRQWWRKHLDGTRLRVLEALRDGNEHPSAAVAARAGLTQAEAIRALESLKRSGFADSRLESAREHQAREKDPGKAFKGPRRQLWRVTASGKSALGAR